MGGGGAPAALRRAPPFFVRRVEGVRYASLVSLPLRPAACALVGAVLFAASGCLIYGEDLLLEGEGGGGATGGSGGSGGAGGCTGVCTHLLISEIVVTPTNAELVEVFNPLEEAVSLQDVWIADFPDYYTVTSGAPSVGATDFLVQFPPGSSIEPGERLVVAIDAAGEFAAAYGEPADFDIHTMPGEAVMGMSGLANGDEMIILFQWDGAAPLVRDLDYVIWGNASDAVDKTGVMAGGQSYAADTPAGMQSVVGAPQGSTALHRCDIEEPGEIEEGGNGVLGHDETSEDIAAAFAEAVPSPKAAPPAGACP